MTEKRVHTPADVEVAAQYAFGLVNAVGSQETGAVLIVDTEGAHGGDGGDEFHGGGRA